MTRQWKAAALAVLVLGAGSALAQASVVVVDEDAEVATRPAADMQGVSVLVGGGLEGYTFDLSPQIDPGVAYAARAILRPTRVLGLEVAYQGSVHEVDAPLLGDQGLVDGADLVRNGGQVALTVGLTATPVQPYLLAGVGLSNFNFRGGALLGYDDDLVGTVPVGVGVRFQSGKFIADARASYSFLFEEDLPGVGTTDIAGLDFSDAGTYAGTLNIGATF
jgi:hypothetical protein